MTVHCMKKNIVKKVPSKPSVETSTPLPEKLKQRLYPAVLDLFAENDFHQVNIREIYKKSGISPSTIYRYFPSKEDLLFAILTEKIGEIGVLVKEQIKGLESTREIFRRIFWIIMDYYDRNPGVAVTAFITVPMRTWMKEPSYKNEGASILLSEVIREARARGDIDPKITNSMIMDQYYMHFYRQIHLWYFNGMKTKLVDSIPNFFDVFWKTLSPVSTGKVKK